jgi:hypothetical protein
MNKINLRELVELVRSGMDYGSITVGDDKEDWEKEVVYLMVDSNGRIKEISQLDDIFFRIRMADDGLSGFMVLNPDQFMVFDYSKVEHKGDFAYLIGTAVLEITIHEGDCITKCIYDAIENLANISVPVFTKKGAVNAFNVSTGYYLGPEEEK